MLNLNKEWCGLPNEVQVSQTHFCCFNCYLRDFNGDIAGIFTLQDFILCLKIDNIQDFLQIHTIIEILNIFHSGFSYCLFFNEFLIRFLLTNKINLQKRNIWGLLRMWRLYLKSFQRINSVSWGYQPTTLFNDKLALTAIPSILFQL